MTPQDEIHGLQAVLDVHAAEIEALASIACAGQDSRRPLLYTYVTSFDSLK